MLFIQGKNLNLEHPNQTKNILEDLTFNIDQNSRIGLIGENGSGKTTFIKFISGQYKNFIGQINKNSNLKISSVVQEIKEQDMKLENYLWKDNPADQIREKIYLPENSQDILLLLEKYEELGGYAYELKIEKHLTRFNFTQDDLSKKINQFSGGEKTKISMLKTILEDADLILFDEPVNNLDTDSIIWLEKYIKNLDKPFILISHERNILDLCVKEIWELADNTLKIYKGNYSDYKKSRQENINRIKSQNENIDRHVLELKIAAAKRKSKAESFENFKAKRSIKNNGGICQRDEGSVSARLSVKKMMKGAVALEVRQEKLLSEKVIIKKKKNIGMIFENNQIKSKNILIIENISIDFENHSLKNIKLEIKPDDKIIISGKNGIGKSTLLKIISNLNENYKGSFKWSPQAKISYFSQNHDNLDFSKTVIAELISDCDCSENEIRNILSYLGMTENQVFSRVADLSLGERAKVILTKIILAKNNVLILDEPTNNLDIKSREALEKALVDFKGCIIMVTHDLYLKEKVINKEIFLESYIFS